MNDLRLTLATKSDIPAIIEMVQKFFQASPYVNFVFSPNKIRDILETKLGQEDFICLLLMCADEHVGMLIALRNELLFSHQTVTCELAWWVNEEYRGTKSSMELLNAYEYWSKNVAKADACQMVALQTLTPDKLDKLYRLKGYDHFESAYMKEWN